MKLYNMPRKFKVFPELLIGFKLRPSMKGLRDYCRSVKLYNKNLSLAEDNQFSKELPYYKIFMINNFKRGREGSAKMDQLFLKISFDSLKTNFNKILFYLFKS